MWFPLPTAPAASLATHAEHARQPPVAGLLPRNAGHCAGMAVATVKRAMRVRPTTGGIGLVGRDRKQPNGRKPGCDTDNEQAGIEEGGLSAYDELLAIDQRTTEKRKRSGDCGCCRSATAEEAAVVILRDDIAHPRIPGAALDGSHRLIA
jgi:hypothetical protein